MCFVLRLLLFQVLTTIMVEIGFIVTTIIFHGGTKELSEEVVNSLPTTDKTETDDDAVVIFTLFLFNHESQSTIRICIWC